MKSPSTRGNARVTLAGTARLLIFATLLVPVVVVPGFFFPFVTVRAVFFRVIVQLASALLLYAVVRRDVAFNFRRDVVLWALGLWVGVNALAAVLGVAPIRSIFGDHERMGGVWFWVHLLAYYVLLRTFLRSDDWWRFFRIAVAVAAAIAAYGLLQDLFHPFTFRVGGLRGGVTIGNPGLLAVYLLANVAFCALLAVRAGARARIGYLVIAMLIGVALVFTGNRSSTLSLLVGSGGALVAYAIWSGSLRGRRALIVAVLVATAATLPMVTRAPWARPVTSRIPALDRLASGVDSSRVIQWRAAVDGIRARPLLGVGPENYQVIWSQYHHPEMYRFIADSPWDRAHNAYLDAFTSAGVFGFLSLLAIWLALLRTTNRAARRYAAAGDAPAVDGRAGAAEAIALGFFVAYAFYLLFWFFDLTSTMLWIALGAFVASRATAEPLIEIGARREKRWQGTVILGFGAAVLVSVLYVHGFETLRMARTLIQARNVNRPMHETLAAFESVFSSPAPVTQHAFLMYAGHLRSLYPRFSEIRRDPTRAELFDRAFVLAIKEFERQAVQDPLNERVLVQHARVLMLGANYYGNRRLYESGLRKLQRAVELAPRRVATILTLGAAYLNGDQPERALELFQRAYAVYPPFGQSHSYLAAAYAELGDYEAADRWLRSAMAYGYTPRFDLVRRLAQARADDGSPADGAELARDYLREIAGPAYLWPQGGLRSGGPYRESANLAADLFSAAGDTVRSELIRETSPPLCAPLVPLLSLAGLPSRLGRFQEPPDCPEPWRSADVF